MEVTMIRALGTLSSLLVVGLGVAAACLGTTVAAGPAAHAATSELIASRAQEDDGLGQKRTVADWSLIAQNAIVAVGKKFPGEAAVHMGIVHAAIYDAVVAIKGGYRPYAITATVPPTTSVEAAVATAAHRVLVGRFSDQQASLDDAYVAYLNGLPDGEAKTNGILVGEEVGVGMLVHRANDGLDRIVSYVQRPTGPGVYEPTAPAAPLGTRMPGVLPLALQKASQFRPDGPPALPSVEYALDFTEVKGLGRFDSSVRTAEQTAVARFWTDHDLPQWNRSLLRLADARSLTAIETARMLAMAHVAGGDAMIGCFDAKYHYLSWRPIHAIRRADTDGNSHTLPDPTWQPLLPTPNHPEYPSAHACHTTAIAEALESFFGPRRLRFSVDSLVTGETRHYKGFSEVAAEVNDARVWAGFHFRYAQEDGSRIGREVARFVVRNFFQPLD
jgi:PAP2 superfamily